MRQASRGDPRVEKLYRSDRALAYFSLLALWLTVLFVHHGTLPNVGDGGVVLALVVSAALVLFFNTAAIIVMLTHYSEDKENIYGLDLYYRDEAKKNG